MTKTYRIELRTDPEEVIDQARRMADEYGALLQGDIHSGSFRGKGLVGMYELNRPYYEVTITEKPFGVPWLLIESVIHSFFDRSPSSGTRRTSKTPKQENDMQSRNQEADGLIRSHVLWSMGGGLIPIPIADMAAVAALQVSMLQQLAQLYEVPFSQPSGKTFVAALTGSSVAKIGASLIKVIPGFGTLLGGFAMSITSGASTYAVGQVAKKHFESGGTLGDIDLTQAKEWYKTKFEEGKTVAENLKKEQEERKSDSDSVTMDEVTEALEKLHVLKEKGLITEEDFAAQKERILSRI